MDKINKLVKNQGNNKMGLKWDKNQRHLSSVLRKGDYHILV